MFYDRAYITSAICTPSRISILLSQFERKHGVNFNSGTSVAPEAWSQSYPVVLREAGYYTGWVGKNHAPIGKGGYQSGLMEKSFDYFYAGHGHIRFYPKDVHEIFKHAKEDTQVEILDESINDFLSNEHRLEGAIRFLDSRPSNKPFCLNRRPKFANLNSDFVVPIEPRRGSTSTLHNCVLNVDVVYPFAPLMCLNLICAEA